MSILKPVTTAPEPAGATELPTISIVLLVYNRRDELRTSLREMLSPDVYDQSKIDVIVVDNASEDGSSEMVRSEFPDVRLVRRELNNGVSGFNDGFALATGEWVLALDDDCYLPGDGLRLAVEGAKANDAQLVSFGVITPHEADYRFDHRYRTGLLTFWGCAALIRGDVLRELGGYDPEIFVWANELEFTLRFFDRGHRHLHLPDVEAVHMKEVVTDSWLRVFDSNAYFINQRHFAYIAAKLLRGRDAYEALIAQLATNLRFAIRSDRRALRGIPKAIAGFTHGLRHRDPVSNREISRSYRRNFHSWASPWWISRPPSQIALAPFRFLAAKLTGRTLVPPPGRRDDYYAERERYYPKSSSTLEF